MYVLFLNFYLNLYKLYNSFIMEDEFQKTNKNKTNNVLAVEHSNLYKNL